MIIIPCDDIHFGMEGWGPERAMYEAIFVNTKLHIKSGKNWHLVESGGNLKNVWGYIMNHLKSENGNRINLNEIYIKLQKPHIWVKTWIDSGSCNVIVFS